MQIKLECTNTIHSETDTHVYSFFKGENICVECDGKYDKNIRTIAEITLLSNYKFDKYQTEKESDTINNIFIVCDKENSGEDFVELERYLREGLILGQTTILARELVNEPANI